MNYEYGLMIIWEKARDKESQIIEDLKTRFTIRNVVYTTWNKEIFSVNLTRFYGENLPKNSFKEKHCGNGTFTVIILIDKDPLYAWRPTSHGKEYVNVNFFDTKELYRKWTGQHRIHCTNGDREFRHDLMMLFGRNSDDFFSEYKAGEVFSYDKDVIGNLKWETLKQVFYVLNETAEYVVLRNFDNLPEEIALGEHSDLDILCKNEYNSATILNAIKLQPCKNRAKYRINVGNSFINIDLRHPGDDYYDSMWENDILNSREKHRGFYIPGVENYKYSLLYHALVQKTRIADNYRALFRKWFGEQSNIDSLFETLKNYLDSKSYKIVPPKDYSVYFNEKLCGIKGNIKQKIYFKLYPGVALINKLSLKPRV